MGTSSLIYKEIEADSYKSFPHKERVLCGWTVGVLCGTGGFSMAMFIMIFLFVYSIVITLLYFKNQK